MNYIYQKIELLNLFRAELSKKDLAIIDKFDLILTSEELEVRSRDVYAQCEMLEHRYDIQKITTSILDVEVVMYDSVFSCYPNTRLGIFIS